MAQHTADAQIERLESCVGKQGYKDTNQRIVLMQYNMGGCKNTRREQPE